MKNRLSTKLLFLLLVIVTYSLNGQELIGSKGPRDSTNFLLQNYPLLTPPVTLDGIMPYYRVFYIYGDGEYDMDTIRSGGASEVNHRYPEQVLASTSVPNAPTASLMSSSYRPRIYAISTYSNGAPPPDRLNGGPVGNDTDVTTYPEAVQARSVVESDDFIKLFPHAEAKKGEPLVYVVSFKNPLELTLDRSTLYLMYNGKVREVAVNRKGSRTVKETGKTASFPVEDVLVHSSRADSRVNEYGSQLNTDLLDFYQKAMAFNIRGLNSGEEGRVFVEFTVDTINYNYFSGKRYGEVDFTAVLVSHDTGLAQEEYLSDAERSFVNSIGFDSTIVLANSTASDLVYQYDRLRDSTIILLENGDNGEVPGFGNIIDVNTHTVSFVKEHDPNFLAVDACTCPGEQNRKKLFFTLHAENDGLGEVSSAYFDMVLPEGIDADDIVDTPVSYHPYNPELNSDDFVNLEKIDDKHIRWSFTNQLVRSVQEFGVGHPNTYLEIQFLAFTDVEPSSLDSMLQTCIRFNNLSNEALCTYPVPVNFITGDDTERATLLECETCEEALPSPPPGIPLWVWILLILLLIILLIIWLSRRN